MIGQWVSHTIEIHIKTITYYEHDEYEIMFLLENFRKKSTGNTLNISVTHGKCLQISPRVSHEIFELLVSNSKSKFEYPRSVYHISE